MCLFLLGHTNSATTSSSCLGVLTTDTETPPVTETPVRPDLLQTLQILSQFVVKTVRQKLAESTISLVLLPVKEPIRNLICSWVLHDGDHLLNFFFSELTSPLGDINIGFFAHLGGKALSYPLDGGKGKGDVALSINVGVEDTQNMLEFFWKYKSCHF